MPYLAARGPPAFSAMLPPIVQEPREDGIGRIEEAGALDFLLEGFRDDAGLDDREEILAVDLEDPVHRAQVERHAAADRERPAREAGPGPLGRHGEAQLPLGCEQRHYLRLGPGPHHDFGPGAEVLRLVPRVRGERFFVGMQSLRWQAAGERLRPSSVGHEGKRSTRRGRLH